MKTNKNSDNARLRAFTLLELLVVMAVSGILAALLLPTLARSEHKAQQIRCTSNLHQLGLGLQNFVADNQAYPSLCSPTNNGGGGIWDLQLERGGLDIAVYKTNAWAEGVWRCPSVKFNRDPVKHGLLPLHFYNISYGYNAFGSREGNTNTHGLTGEVSLENPQLLFGHINASEVVDPSDMMAIGDSINGNPIFQRSSAYLRKGGLAEQRHHDRLNVVFCDDHVESPTLDFLEANTNDVALCRWNRDHLPHRERL
jgi:prepilin-type N-terminal cleavage/methylation domain-containing protein